MTHSQPKHVHYGVWIALGSILILRLFYAHRFGWTNIPPGTDAESYHAYALAILNQSDWLTQPTFFGDYRPPGYPMFMALVYGVFGHNNLLALYGVQSLLSVLTCYYIYRLAREVVGQGWAWLPFVWAGAYLFYFWYVAMVWRETLIFFLMVYGFYYLAQYLLRPPATSNRPNADLWRFILSFAFLIHTDSRYLAYLPFLLLLFVWQRPLSLKRGVIQFVWMAVIFGLLMIPWTLRNYQAYGGFVLINTRTLDLTKEEKLFTRGFLKSKPVRVQDQARDGMVQVDFGARQKTVPLETVLQTYPKTSLAKAWFHLKELWRPLDTQPTYYGVRYNDKILIKVAGPWSRRHNLLSMAFYGTLLPFLAYGVLQIIRRRPPLMGLLLFPLVMQSLFHTVTWGMERYRLPVDAFVMIIAAYGFQHLWQGLRAATARKV